MIAMAVKALFVGELGNWLGKKKKNRSYFNETVKKEKSWIFFFPFLTFTCNSKMNKKYLAHTLMALCGLLQREHGLGQQWFEQHSMLVRPDDIRISSSCVFDGVFCSFGFCHELKYSSPEKIPRHWFESLENCWDASEASLWVSKDNSFLLWLSDMSHRYYWTLQVLYK